MIIHSEGYNLRRGTGSPFDAQITTDLGGSAAVPCHWCSRCHMSVEVKEIAHNQNQVWGKKYFCKRCGAVTLSAVWYQVASLSEPESDLLVKAKQWASEAEKITK